MELCLKYYLEYVYHQIKMLLIKFVCKKFERERKVIIATAYPWEVGGSRLHKTSIKIKNHPAIQ